MNSLNSWLAFSLAYPYLFCKSPKGCPSFPFTLLCHSAAKNAGNSLNASLYPPHDCGNLKQGFLDPALNLDLKLFDPHRHIMHHFNPILDPIDLPMNRLDDTSDLSRDGSDVATNRSNCE